MVHAALLHLMLEDHGPRFTISLKRSTQNIQLSTSSPADYPIFCAAVGSKADISQGWPGVVIRRQTPPNSYRQSRRRPGTNSSTDRSHHRNTTRSNSPPPVRTAHLRLPLRREYGLVPSQRVSDGSSPFGRAGCL